MLKWLVTAFLAITFAVLSFNAFISSNLSQQTSGNRLISMLTDLCAVGIVMAAVMDGRKPAVRQAGPDQ